MLPRTSFEARFFSSLLGGRMHRHILAIVVTLSTIAVARTAFANPCTQSVTYSTQEITNLKSALNTLGQTCTGSVSAAQAAIMEQILINHTDRTFANFLIAYFHGCYNGGVAPAFTEVLAHWFMDRPFINDADDAFERRLQRGIVLAIVDRYLSHVSTAGGVIALGDKMEGNPSLGPADCNLRHDVVRTLRVLDYVTSHGNRISSVMRDEVYNAFKNLVAQEGAPLTKFGITPNPASFPWLGPQQASVWRAMRFIRLAMSGDTLNRLQYATDIRVETPFYAKYRKLILDHGIILTDGDGLAQDDWNVNPIYGTNHELGYKQLQLSALNKLIDLYPSGVSPFIYSINQRDGLGDACFLESSTNRCAIPDNQESCNGFVTGGGTVPCGICTQTGTPCASTADCQDVTGTATQKWGPSGYSGSRCSRIPDTNETANCPWLPYPNKTTAVSGPDLEKCVGYGVNINGSLVADPGSQAGWFPTDAPNPNHQVPAPNPPRPVFFPKFCHVAQHEVNHAVEFWKVRQNTTLNDWQNKLIDRACNVGKQYLWTIATFCGTTTNAKCNGIAVTPTCTQARAEFVSAIANIYQHETQRTLDLARVRWDATPSFREPINQFLFFLGIYSTADAVVPNQYRAPFFYQNVFQQPYPHSPQGYYDIGVPPNGLCQYHTADATFVKDTVGRVTLLTTPNGKTHTFGYGTNAALTAPVTTWFVQ